MFIKEIITTKFGGLKDGTYNFSDVFNIIRGKNGAGKSSLVESILYGMFGTSALRGTIEDTVTYGSQPSELKVNLQYGPYTVKRSKSSASVVGEGLKINGQSAVSKFFYDLLGVQKGSENSVLISGQGSTAGILSGKPGEVSALIEGLANFDQIDKAIERVKEKYPSGNAHLLKGLLLETDEKIAEKEAIELVSPVGYLDKVTQGNARLEIAASDLSDLLKSIQSKKEEVIKIEAGVELKEKLYQEIEDHKNSLSILGDKLATATALSKEGTPEVSKEKALVDDWPAVVARWDLYKSVTAFVVWEGEEWDEGTDSLDAALLNENKKANELTGKIADAKAELRTSKKQLNSEETCPTCGQATKHIHEEINAKAEADISVQGALLKDLTVKVSESEEVITVLRRIKSKQGERKNFEKYTDNVELLPWHIEWTDDVPAEPSSENFNSARAAIKACDEKEAAIAIAAEDVGQLTGGISDGEKRLEETQYKFRAMFTQDPSDLKAIIKALQKAYLDSLEEFTADEKAVKADQEEADRLTLAAKYLEKELDDLTEESLNLSKKLKKDSRNLEILKQVRKARPLVLNKVWGNVLNMVTMTFSDLRGVESKVEKSDKGFLVNGLPVLRLSGSEKSILGISLRVALREIFAPSAGFLVFDEAASDCDSERTAAVTAALASVRGQVISITHDEISDGSADNIIELT